MKTSYPQELIDIAKEKGYKAANLEYLDQILLEFNKEQGDRIAIKVPKHISISDSDIVEHINPLWKELWKEFTELQGDFKNGLKPEALLKLQEIQNIIQQSFGNDHKFIVDGMDQNAKQMVRSTGDEDRVDVANPGGNESVPSDGESISSSIGTVVASYFSEKSMSQRLKSGENITKKPPLMPCLIQELVGETAKDRLPPVSGIIYTDKRNIRIQAAYGHGELVVNSKGNFDNYFVTNEDVVHQYIGDKKVRIVPKLNSNLKKIELEEVENSEFAHAHSLSEEQSVRLAKFSKFVQEKYGMRMDLEFVFDPNINTINIVQARPIPEGKRKGVAPSALSNDFISRNKPEHTSGEIITPDVMVAKAITSKDEVIICESIDQALTSYLKKNNNNKIKAVIINKTAPDTSHEAGFFTSQAISVIHVDNFAQANAWIRDLTDKVLIIDPQHASLYRVSTSQYKDSLIEEGVFRSTLAEHVTPVEREFAQGPSTEFPQIKAKTIGELVIEARSNPDAAQKLFRFIYDEIGTRENKLYGKEEVKEDLKKLLSFPATKEEYLAQKQTLANLLEFISNIQNGKQISSATFEQLIINGYELYKAINEIEANPEDLEAKLNYLNIHQKLSGLIASKGKTGVLSTSLFSEIAQYDQREELKREIIARGYILDTQNEKGFLELAKHKEHFINKADQDKWLSFCYEAFKVEETAQKLQNLVNNVSKLGLKDYWLNVNFIESYEKSPAAALQNLQIEYEHNLSASKDILKAGKTIDRMEHQVGQWSDPKNFKKLFKSLQSDIQEVSNLIKIDEENKFSSSLGMKKIYRLVDAIDLSIKQLQNSPLYEDKAQQVQNFKMMLDEFFKVMKNQIGDIHPLRAQEMQNFMISKAESNEQNELLPSADFSVIKASFFQDNSEGFSRGFKEVGNKNLADVYTLVHQTLLDSIGRQSKEINQDLSKRLPQFVQEVERRVLADRSEFLNGYEGWSHRGNKLEKLSFLYIDQAYPYVNLHYKIPLQNHAGMLKLKYNIHKESIELDFTVFGQGDSNRGNRWKVVEEASEWFFEVLTDAKLLQHKSDDNHVNFSIEIRDGRDLDNIFKILDTLSHATNTDARSLDSVLSQKNTEFYQKKIALLDEENFLKKIISLAEDERQTLKKLIAHELIQQERIDDALKIAARIIEPRYLIDIAHQLIQKDKIDDAFKVVDGITDPRYLSDIAIELVKKDRIDDAFKVVDRITGPESLYRVAIKLIQKDRMDDALKIAAKITDPESLYRVAIELIQKYRIDGGITDLESLYRVAIELIQKDGIDDAFKVVDRVTEPRYLSDIAIELVKKDRIDDAFKVVDRITGPESLYRVAIELIQKDRMDDALKIAAKITDPESLYRVAIELIQKYRIGHSLKFVGSAASDSLTSVMYELIQQDRIEDAFKIVGGITNQWHLAYISHELIQKDRMEDALKITARITDLEELSDIAIELVKKDKIDDAFKIIARITEPLYLGRIAAALIRNDKIDAVLKIADMITNPRYYHYLGVIAKELIRKDRIDGILKITERITDQTTLNDIVYQLNSKQHYEEAAKIAEQITMPRNLAAAYYKTTNLFSSYLPKKWSILPAVEAIDESSFRKVNDPTVDIEPFNRQEKTLPQFNDSQNLTVNKLPNLDMMRASTLIAPSQEVESVKASYTPLQDVGAQAALAAVTGVLLYDAGKAAYNLYKCNTGPKAEPKEIEQAKRSLKKVFKLDHKGLSEIYEQFEKEQNQLTFRLNALYDAKRSNSEEYKNLEKQLGETIAKKDAVSVLRNSIKAMASEAKYFLEPQQYTLKKGYVDSIIQECSNIKGMYDELGISKVKSQAKKIQESPEIKEIRDKLNIRLLSKLASGREFEEGSEHRTGAYIEVREDSSTEPTYKLPTEVEFRKKSIVMNSSDAIPEGGKGRQKSSKNLRVSR